MRSAHELFNRKKDFDEEYDIEEYEDFSDEYGDDQGTARRRSSGRNRGINGWVGLFIGIIIGAAAIAAVFAFTTTRSQATTATEMDYETKVEFILSYLKAYYLNDLDDETIETALAKGLMANIGDKYARTVYPIPSQLCQMHWVKQTWSGRITWFRSLTVTLSRAHIT